jgi:hypothetical protein
MCDPRFGQPRILSQETSSGNCTTLTSSARSTLERSPASCEGVRALCRTLACLTNLQQLVPEGWNEAGH